MIWVLLVLMIVMAIFVVANAVTLARQTALIARHDEEIVQLQNESAYLHKQLAIRRNTKAVPADFSDRVTNLAERAKEARRGTPS